jgi:hypothetical protein
VELDGFFEVRMHDIAFADDPGDIITTPLRGGLGRRHSFPE